jgi:hypothetical protein
LLLHQSDQILLGVRLLVGRLVALGAAAGAARDRLGSSGGEEGDGESGGEEPSLQSESAGDEEQEGETETS